MSGPRASSRSPASRRPILPALDLPDDALVVVIEGVEKPGNLGAVLRSADGAGADAVIAASPRTDLFNPNTIRASAGTVFALPLAAAPTPDVLAWLRDAGFRIVAARVDAAASLHRRGPHRPARDRPRRRGGRADRDVDRRRHRAGPIADARRRRQPERVGQRRGPALRSPTPTGVTMDTFDFVIIGAGPAGEAAAYKARELGASVAVIDRRWFGGSCPHIGCLPSKSLLDGAARHHANPAAYDWPAASAARDYMVNRPPDAAEPDDASHVRAPRRRRRRGLPRSGRDHRPGPARRPARRRRPRHRGRQRHDRGRLRVEGAAARGDRPDPDLDEPRGDARPRAAEEPARPRRRADRLRAGPGLRPVRRPDDDRPVRPTARPDRPSAQLRDDPSRPRTGRGDRADRCPRPARPGGCGSRRRPRHRPRRRLDRGGPRDPARRRPRRSRSRTSVSSTTASTRAAGRRSRATAACGSPTGCGSSATRPVPSSTPTRPTTRASSPFGWPSARTVVPDYRALPRATYTDPEASSVGLHPRGGGRGRHRRLRARRRLRDERQGLRASRPSSAT